MSLSNSTATLKILNREIYEKNYLLNSSPIKINGEEFLSIQEDYRHGVYHPSNYTTIHEEGSRHIRFSGGIYGTDLVYRPGNYVISTINFNLLVILDGPGSFIEIFLITTSLIVLICYSLYITIKYIRKIEIPYKKRTKKKDVIIFPS